VTANASINENKALIGILASSVVSLTLAAAPRAISAFLDEVHLLAATNEEDAEYYVVCLKDLAI